MKAAISRPAAQYAVVVDDPGVHTCGAVQDRGKSATRDLYVVSADLGENPTDAATTAIHDGERARKRGGPSQGGQQVHVLDHRQDRPTNPN